MSNKSPWTITALIGLMAGLLLTACTGTPTATEVDSTSIAVAVAETQTQAALATLADPGATVTAPPAGEPSNTPAAEAPGEATATAEVTATASATPTQSPTPTFTPGAGPVAGPTSGTPGLPGTISGKLGYPSEVIPRLKVYAWDRESGQWRYILTNQNQNTYTVEVPPGEYVVFAYLNDGGELAGGYTNAVLCGLSVDCNDHALIQVTVGSGQEVSAVDVTDWYGPPGFVPPAPG